MDELMSYEDLKNHLLSISDKEKQALFCFIYGGMAREGEIVNSRYSKRKGIRGEDIEILPNMVKITVRSEKSSRRSEETGLIKKTGHNARKVPIFRNREAWLCNIIESWVAEKGSGPLFDFSTRWAEYQFHKWFPDIVCRKGGHHDGGSHTIHFLRAWRYSHYRRGNITGLIVDSKVASLFGGWVSSTVPERLYDMTKLEDYYGELENV